MNYRIGGLLFVAAASLLAAVTVNSNNTVASGRMALCSASWQKMVDDYLSTGDGAGHGPDIGSNEWQSVVEFTLGIRGQTDIPQRATKQWCKHIDQLVQNKALAQTENKTLPSFPCDNNANGTIEVLICQDQELSKLDRKLSNIYALAANKAKNERPALLAAEQRGWIKGRNQCWQSNDKRACVLTSYTRRNAELQAKYKLVPSSGALRFICDNNASNEVIVTFFQTKPATLIAERGDSVSFMYLQPSENGKKYYGRNETIWQHQGNTKIVWGYNAPEMQCVEMP
ncbi:MAG: MliC family protein [Cognaticolwellia sp.]